MVNWNFVVPWLSKTNGQDQSTALEFNNLKTYLARIDSGDLPLFNPHLQNATVDNLIINNSVSGIVLGRIKQIIQATATTPFSTTSTSFVATNLTGSIIPSSTSSQILVIASGSVGQGTGASAQVVNATIFRGSTNLGNSTNGLFSLRGETGNASQSHFWPATMIILDSPASTSSVTYTAEIDTGSAALSCNFGNGEIQTLTMIEYL